MRPVREKMFAFRSLPPIRVSGGGTGRHPRLAADQRMVPLTIGGIEGSDGNLVEGACGCGKVDGFG